MAKVITQIRRYVTPIDASCLIVEKVGEDFCPSTQTYDMSTRTFIPSRTRKPTVIEPTVVLGSRDGSLSLSDATSVMVGDWYVEKTDANNNTITTNILADNSPLKSSVYVVDTDNGTYKKHALVINKDLTSDNVYNVYWVGKYNDVRLVNTVIEVRSNKIRLSTNVNAESKYRASVGGEENIIYEPLKDTLVLGEYLAARNELPGGRPLDSYKNPFNYVHDVTVHLMYGQEAVDPHSYFLVVLRNTGGAWVEVQHGDVDVPSITNNVVTLDLRFYAAAQYQIKCVGWEFRNDLASIVISTKFIEPCLTDVEVITAKTIAYGSERQSASVTAKDEMGHTIEGLDAYADVVWGSHTNNTDVAELGYGSSILFDVSKTGLSELNNDAIQLSVDVEPRGRSYITTDESGTQFVDESNRILIL